ncbi:MAG: hypothetical protein ABSA97_01315 [Verrucomicrobiia bacterium]
MNPQADLLNGIQRGLAGYVTYLSACLMKQAYSEYLLYEPILRILTAHGCRVVCEYPCKGLGGSGPGDKRRIDFKASHDNLDFVIEVKWAKAVRINIQRDCEKLAWFKATHPGSAAYLCVFGRRKYVEGLNLRSDSLREVGSAVFA